MITVYLNIVAGPEDYNGGGRLVGSVRLGDIAKITKGTWRYLVVDELKDN